MTPLRRSAIQEAPVHRHELVRPLEVGQRAGVAHHVHAPAAAGADRGKGAVVGEIPAGAIDDEAGNDYAGTSTYTITTVGEAGPPPGF